MPTDVKVQIHGAFMVEVFNSDPVYTKCKVCNTKIDRDTQECKKASTGCPATPGEMTALSGIRLGDFSGGNVEILEPLTKNVLLGGRFLGPFQKGARAFPV